MFTFGYLVVDANDTFLEVTFVSVFVTSFAGGLGFTSNGLSEYVVILPVVIYWIGIQILLELNIVNV